MNETLSDLEMAKAVGERLTLFREKVVAPRMTQQMLASVVGTTQTGLSQFENGTRLLTLQVALNLCKHYNLTLDWLYHGDPSGLPVRMNNRLIELQELALKEKKQVSESPLSRPRTR